jgi:hypothetical protein
MTRSAQSAAATPPGPARSHARPAEVVVRPFAGLIDPILVEEPVHHHFAGSLSRDAAAQIWTWVVRDLCPDLISFEGVTNGHFKAADFEPLVAEVLTRIKAGVDAAQDSGEGLRRLRAQVGRDDALALIEVARSALRNRALLGKAQTFGKAINGMTEDAALGVALQSMPLADPKLAALLFQAALSHVSNPTRMVTAVIKLSGAATESAVLRQGFGPMVDAFLAHAQNQIHLLHFNGPFADIDMACRSLTRFHRLVRALTGYIEMERGSRITQTLTGITKQVSDRVEPRLKEVPTDINFAMRRPREGADRLDTDRMLSAINGVYLLSTVRDCRDSLALNAVFDLAWSQAGEALEMHIQRNLDLLRQQPGDAMIGARIDAAIKMAEVRFNAEYAETLRRARAAAERRA